LRESLTDWLQNKKYVSTSDFITLIKEQKNAGKSWAGISSLVLGRYGISLDKETIQFGGSNALKGLASEDALNVMLLVNPFSFSAFAFRS